MQQPSTPAPAMRSGERQSWLMRRGTCLLAAGLLALGLSGCVEQVPARFTTADSLPDDERRADGVAVDMTSAPPPYRYAATSEDAVVTLRAPLGEQAAFKVIRAFFVAVSQERIGGITVLTESGARIFDLRGGKRGRTHNVTSLWRQRFSKHTFEQLPAQIVYRETAIASFGADHIEQLPLPVRYTLADQIRPRDLLLQVPITTPGVLNERFFGNEIYFLLRPEKGRYVIAAMAEQIPF